MRRTSCRAWRRRQRRAARARELPDAAAGIDRPYVSEAKLQLDGARHGLKERVVLGHQDPVCSAAFSPDGLRIVTASADRTARIWDAESGQPIGDRSEAMKVRVSRRFQPRRPAYRHRVRRRDSADLGRRAGSPIGEPLTGHQDPVYSAVFSPRRPAHRYASADTWCYLGRR